MCLPLHTKYSRVLYPKQGHYSREPAHNLPMRNYGFHIIIQSTGPLNLSPVAPRTAIFLLDQSLCFIFCDAILSDIFVSIFNCLFLVIKNKTDFFTLILPLQPCYSNLLVLIDFQLCFCFGRFLMQTMTLTVNKECFTSLFPIWMSFILFSCIIALASIAQF